MNCNPTLTSQEFKVLHNCLCDLDRFSQFREISDIVERIRRVALKGAYEQDNRVFETKHDYYSDFREANQLTATWSIYELPAPGGFLQPHSWPSRTHVIYDEHWGDKPTVVEIQGNTWADLYRAADAAIRASGDTHHCFIEAFTPIEDKPGYLRLSTGS